MPLAMTVLQREESTKDAVACSCSQHSSHIYSYEELQFTCLKMNALRIPSIYADWSTTLHTIHQIVIQICRAEKKRSIPHVYLIQ